MYEELIKTFVTAVKIDALSLRERPVADAVRQFLSGVPVRIVEDDIGAEINGNCGNVICIPEWFDPLRPAIALISHMDTPRSTANVRPVVDQIRVTSDGTTALGVDNRAGFSILLQVLREHHRKDKMGNFIVVFTVAEEIGMLGARHIDLTKYNVRMGFVFDCSQRPGTFIQSAVGSSLFDVTFIGKTSHAGVEPEKGLNAILMTAKALSQIKVGRLSPRMTSNVGIINGGVATNVVPDRCSIQGEVRAFDLQMIDEHLDMLKRTFRATALEHNGNVDFSVNADFPPFVLNDDSEVLRFTVNAITAVGLEPDPIEYLGGSDANMLNARGIPSVNLGIGAQNAHSNGEFILIEDLRKSVEIAAQLISLSDTLS